jgi:hypothetical protein
MRPLSAAACAVLFVFWFSIGLQGADGEGPNDAVTEAIFFPTMDTYVVDGSSSPLSEQTRFSVSNGLGPPNMLAVLQFTRPHVSIPLGSIVLGASLRIFVVGSAGCPLTGARLSYSLQDNLIDANTSWGSFPTSVAFISAISAQSPVDGALWEFLLEPSVVSQQLLGARSALSTVLTLVISAPQPALGGPICTFYSLESTFPVRRPQLAVRFKPPPTAGANLVLSQSVATFDTWIVAGDPSRDDTQLTERTTLEAGTVPAPPGQKKILLEFDPTFTPPIPPTLPNISYCWLSMSTPPTLPAGEISTVGLDVQFSLVDFNSSTSWTSFGNQVDPTVLGRMFGSAMVPFFEWRAYLDPVRIRDELKKGAIKFVLYSTLVPAFGNFGYLKFLSNEQSLGPKPTLNIIWDASSVPAGSPTTGTRTTGQQTTGVLPTTATSGFPTTGSLPATTTGVAGRVDNEADRSSESTAGYLVAIVVLAVVAVLCFGLAVVAWVRGRGNDKSFSMRSDSGEPLSDIRTTHSDYSDVRSVSDATSEGTYHNVKTVQ